MAIEFERVSLYEEVWTTPLTQLAKKYGLSDNGIRKVCKAMNIPLPTAGHWAKVGAGQVVPKTPLPPEADRTTFVSRPTPADMSFELPADQAWLAERIAFEQRPENAISVDLTPRRWHRAIAPIRDQLRVALREVESDRREGERADKRSRASPQLTSSPGGWKWRMFCDRGQILADTHKAISVRVTPQTYERALAVLNSVCWEAEKRGFRAAVRDSGDRIQLTGHGAEIKLRLSEKTTDEWRTERRAWSDKPEHIKFKKPTGKLRLFIQGVSYSEIDISDHKDQPLEKRLNEIFQRIYRQVVRYWQEARRRAEWERQWREESDRRRVEEQRRQEEARLREADLNRRKELVEEAKAWRSASLIRDYVAHVEEAVALLGENLRAGEIREWSIWALTVAEELDPTTTRAGLANGSR